ncbi:uncharacterized protein PHALS_09851 [Plasmopara halstedii]|uniref:Uncharacterized protein n=1 Tax=Plasmopara halstedii TaxID=4781 RepID=A0A0P1AEZ0_PLAHL|nr:uncharacterized protein PHALS_09851 [Plasmopara halstedii]CEG39613.1 hypothetical protein PHALS_09851 [Plasmopara halstedii]|eukprot:XP_024575982.1 hypothetical protein PHALS_09851 [Plasmopara halstedii]
MGIFHLKSPSQKIGFRCYDLVRHLGETQSKVFVMPVSEYSPMTFSTEVYVLVLYLRAYNIKINYRGDGSHRKVYNVSV